MALRKIISGGQTGADQGGLAAGKALGLETGGWLPRGCITQDGPRRDMLVKYGMLEHCSTGYPPRTETNVMNSDGTVLFGNMNSPGCRLTLRLCKQHRKPFYTNPTPKGLRGWVDQQGIKVLNVAGNRESSNPGIFKTTYDTLMAAFGGVK